MRLKRHINESRPEPLDPDEALKRVKEECSMSWNAYKKGHAIYRGTDTPQNNKAVYYPERKGRMSANTRNYYTLVIDNHPKWKGYPKRSDSYICSTSQDTANQFGIPFVVFPKDGSNYGIASSFDLWVSFEKTLDGYNGDLADLNDSIEIIIQDVFEWGELPNPRTFGDLKKIFKSIDQEFKDLGSDITKDIIKEQPLLTGYKGDMLKLFQQILDPDKNKFKQTKNPSKIPENSNQEVWVDGAVYMIRENSIVLTTDDYK
ncbi:MAG: hypothetical protein KAS32_09270 [Candidatus Peribacteraceae bacterium]|nr:hypothetical protein [Candidatus Peribacteraceae bacterium]